MNHFTAPQRRAVALVTHVLSQLDRPDVDPVLTWVWCRFLVLPGPGLDYLPDPLPEPADVEVLDQLGGVEVLDQLDQVLPCSTTSAGP